MTASGLTGVQRWLVQQGDLELELACAEHPEPAIGDPHRVVVRLAVCLRDAPPYEIVELLTPGAARVRVRLDGCASAAEVRAALAPLATLTAVGDGTGDGRLLLDEAQRETPRGTAPDATGAGPDTPGAGPYTPGAAPDPPGAAPARRRGWTRRRASRMVRRPVLEAAHMPLSRRRLVGLPDPAGRPLPDAARSGPQRLVDAIRNLVPPASPALTATRAPALALRAPGCTACGVCTQTCPTDALQIEHTGDGESVVSTLLQDLGSCDGCSRCVQLCPSDVLASAGQVLWARALDRTPEVVASRATTRCDRCRAPFPAGGGRLCPVCDYRRAHPFGSVLPGHVASAGPSGRG